MRNWSKNIDKYGMPTMTVIDGVGEGGDTAQRYGFTLMGIYLNRKYKKPMQLDLLANIAPPSEGLELLECPDCPGDYRRHPEEGIDPASGNTYWYARCDRMSRDQSTGIIAAFLAGRLLNHPFPNRRKRTFHFGFNMAKRFGFTNNKGKSLPGDSHTMGDGFYDWFGLPQWANWIRCFPLLAYVLYPLLMLLDLELLINTLMLRREVNRLASSSANLGHGERGPDVSSYTTRMISTKALTTPISRLSWKLAPIGYMAKRIKQTADYDPENKGFQGPPVNNLMSLEILEKCQKSW